MKRSFPWIFGFIIGVFFMTTVVGVLLVRNAFEGGDPAYRLVAVSWGTPMDQDSPWLYQVQVIADPPEADGILQIHVQACIGGGKRVHDIGPLGTARDMGEAVRKFGEITWLPDRVTIGGKDGIKATLMRGALEKSR